MTSSIEQDGVETLGTVEIPLVTNEGDVNIIKNGQYLGQLGCEQIVQQNEFGCWRSS